MDSRSHELTSYRAFFIFFAISAVLHGIWLGTFGLIDQKLWADQAFYVQTGDSRQYDPKLAYIPPGGPTIEGTIAIHALGFPYETAGMVFQVAFDSLIIAGIATIAGALFPGSLWGWILAFTLPFNRLIEASTPPSLSVSLLAVFIFVLSIRIVRDRRGLSKNAWLLWGSASGLAISLRPEDGVLICAAFGIGILAASGWRKAWKRSLLGAASALAAFWATDPFMWKIPLKHISDVIHKVELFHGPAQSLSIQASPFNVMVISCLALISIALAIIQTVSCPKTESFVPRSLLISALSMTAVLFIIVLTSKYQPPRYLLPAVFIWESLLPAYLVYYLARIKPLDLRSAGYIAAFIAFAFQAAAFYAIF
ncbi:MAG: hypothetical protein KGI45_00835 [Patescibacteria group bacterium]|nr:hypothetical protein [Patescibacteria group bacterium]MDE1940815.1 hypothetical protein [Patescibacteria group bacterium]MDE1966602.1 hypothetical protein [Patescibacteria group bacterium]